MPKLRGDFQEYYSLNIDELGSAYGVRHAFELATVLPDASRIKTALYAMIEAKKVAPTNQKVPRPIVKSGKTMPHKSPKNNQKPELDAISLQRLLKIPRKEA